MLNLYDSTSVSTVNCWCTVRLDEVNYVWTINNYSFHDTTGDYLKSPIFSAVTNDKFKWYLLLEPGGVTDAKNDEMSLFLHLSNDSKGNKACAKYVASILNKEQEKTWSKDFLFREFETSLANEDEDELSGYGWPDFRKKDEFFKNELLVNDKLTIYFNLTFFEMDDRNVETLLNNRCYTAPLQHLSENLASVFENPDFADVILSVQGKDYPAHKVMLAARSKVFAAMFKNDMIENKRNRVEITDMNEEVVREMLRYVYTGMCKNVDKLADGLLAAAEKYDFAHLKSICEESLLSKILSVENAPEILVLADMYRVNELKSEVIDFIVEKSPEVMSTTTWYKIMLSYPRLLNEVCQAFSRRFATASPDKTKKSETATDETQSCEAET